MNEQVLIGTRKGLFRLDTGDDTITPLGFLGVPVSTVLRDPRDGAIYAGLDHGHFGSSSTAPTTTARRGRSCPRRLPGEAGRRGRHQPDDAAAARVDDEAPLEPRGRPRRRSRTRCGAARSPEGCSAHPTAATPGSRRPFWDRPERKAAFGGGYDDPGMHSICVDPRGGGR